MSHRIWIFVTSKALSPSQQEALETNCGNFVSNWTAHEKKLQASFELYMNRLLIFKVDEAQFNASGCSIDKLTRLIKEQEQLFSVELLNRLLVVYEVEDELKVVAASEIKDLLKQGEINENTLVYDNAISTSAQLPNWKKPLKETWLSKYLPSYSA